MALASRGQRDMDSGPEAITSAAVLAQVRRQARRVHLKSVGLGVALAVLALVLPA